MKKLLMIFTMLMAACVFADTWTDPATGLEWTYTISGGEATDVRRTDSRSDVEVVKIPSTLGGCPVTSISSCGGYFTSVTIPAGVKSIGAGAFACCYKLKSVTIPASVTSIGVYIDEFFGTEFQDNAFTECENLMSIKVEEGNPNYKSVNGMLLTKDGTKLLSGVNGKVTIPEGVIEICDYAFYALRGLTSIIISSSVATMDLSATPNLASIEVVENNAHFSSQEGVLFNKSKTELLRYPRGKTGVSYVVPSSVTSIGAWAVNGCKFESVTIPASVTSIGVYRMDDGTEYYYNAFRECKKLMSIKVEEGNPNYKSVNGMLLTKDGTKLVSGVNGKVTIPEGVRDITGAFGGLEGLTSVAIPSSVTSISESAFSNCSGLTSVTISEGVTSIGSQAFSSCSALTSVTIPASVTSIGMTRWFDDERECYGFNVFGGCSKLMSIKVEEGNPNYKSVNGLLLTKDGKQLLSGVNGKVAIPAGVTQILHGAFQYLNGLTRVTIPSSVTSIGGQAFHGCEGLTSVTIPAGVTSIGDGAFEDCSGLTSATIPSGVTSIGSRTFCGCTGLTNVTIPKGVTSIGSWAFQQCFGLTSVAIPDGVTSIEKCAFILSGLMSITIPSSVTDICEDAFWQCTSLKTIYVSKGDADRVEELLYLSNFDTSDVTFIEGTGPTPTPTPEPEPEEEEAFEEKHTFGGLVTDEFGMCGMIQVATAKKSAKGEVKVSGFVMLEDGKKQTLKAVSGKVSGGKVEVTTKAGKTSLSLTITDDGFTGTLGGMAVASAEIGEETGIISGTLKMSYFDAKTGKVKTKSIKISGLASGSIAEGTLTVGKGEPKSFAAEIE